MKESFKKYISFTIIVFFALFLRLYNYTDFPVGGETADESAWAFLGSSIIQTGQPTSWSYFAPYQEAYIYAERENEAPLVRPALDHPPLFSLIPGLAHSLKNSWETFPSLKLIRLPMVIIGSFNVLLLLILADRYFKNKKWVYLSGLLYATIPSFVLSSRLVVAENLLITWTILALIFLRPEKWKYRYLALVGVGAAAVLTKVSGLVVPIAILAYGLMIKNKKISLAGFWGLLLGVCIFVLWGYMYNFDLFLAIFSSQAERDLGLATIHNRFFLHPAIVEKLFFDGWILFGLISSFISVYKNKKTFLSLNIFLLLNLFFIVATSGEQTFHAWYDYMLYPLFVISIVDNLKRIYKTSHFMMLSIVWLLILPLLRVLLTHMGIYGSLSSFTLRMIMGVGLVPLLIAMYSPEQQRNKYMQIIFTVLIVMLLIVNAMTVLNFNQITYWETDTFFYSR